MCKNVLNSVTTLKRYLKPSSNVFLMIVLKFFMITYNIQNLKKSYFANCCCSYKLYNRLSFFNQKKTKYFPNLNDGGQRFVLFDFNHRLPPLVLVLLLLIQLQYLVLLHDLLRRLERFGLCGCKIMFK